MQFTTQLMASFRRSVTGGFAGLMFWAAFGAPGQDAITFSPAMQKVDDVLSPILAFLFLLAAFWPAQQKANASE